MSQSRPNKPYCAAGPQSRVYVLSACPYYDGGDDDGVYVYEFLMHIYPPQHHCRKTTLNKTLSAFYYAMVLYVTFQAYLMPQNVTESVKALYDFAPEILTAADYVCRAS